MTILQSMDQINANVQNHKYIKFGSADKNKIRSFNLYLREKGKIIIDADSVVADEKYKKCFLNVYLKLLFTNPERFILFQAGVGWFSEYTQIEEFQIRNNPKFFYTYYKALFTDSDEIKCRVCSKLGIMVYCNHCGAEFCTQCYILSRDCYYKYNNFFKCYICKGIN